MLDKTTIKPSTTIDIDRISKYTGYRINEQCFDFISIGSYEEVCNLFDKVTSENHIKLSSKNSNVDLKDSNVNLKDTIFPTLIINSTKSIPSFKLGRYYLKNCYNLLSIPHGLLEVHIIPLCDFPLDIVNQTVRIQAITVENIMRNKNMFNYLFDIGLHKIDFGYTNELKVLKMQLKDILFSLKKYLFHCIEIIFSAPSQCSVFTLRIPLDDNSQQTT